MNRNSNELKLCSWNICGVKEKLQDPDIFKFLVQYDMVWLLEVRNVHQKSVPGFYVYNNKSRKGHHRGGVMLLVKCALMPYVTRVDMNADDMIWVELSLCAGVRFGGVYIPPEDSLYSEASPFQALFERCVSKSEVVVLGDFNARVGTPVTHCSDGCVYRYDGVKDHTVNNHGRILLNTCRSNDMIVLNHLSRNERTFGGNFSFRRGSNWISEIDLCLLKEVCVNRVKYLEVNQAIQGSDHAPLCLVLATEGGSHMSPTMLMERARRLGESCYKPCDQVIKRTPKYDTVNLNDFKIALESLDPPRVDIPGQENVMTAISAGCELLSQTACQCKKRVNQQERMWDVSQPRWERILATNDSKLIWKAIDWSGKIDIRENTKPDDEQFKIHFESLLNPEHQVDSAQLFDESIPTIPVLDDAFTTQELEKVIQDVNVNKSYAGICPGLIKALPVNWFLFLLHVFNIIFLNVYYPVEWSLSKLSVLFKGGKDRMECGNYRGISVLDTLAKLYDSLILNRLKLWVSLDECQAGAQQGRGCVEQVMTLRLLSDLANFKKEKLYMLFIDFSKAYDRVPRRKLLEVLKSRGCGKVMLRAIQAMYSCTKNVLRSATVEATVGVRQGAPSSCLFFCLYIDQLVRSIKRNVGTDGFLGTLHTLLLMDDMVILATSREMCLKKLNVVLDYCQEYGMVLNESKTKFLVIRNTQEDTVPLMTRNIKIDYVHTYLYLGAWITDDAKMNTVLALHEATNETHLNKFAIFCAANSNMPYIYKRKVFDAAVTSALLYSSETWLVNHPKKLVTQYNRAMKCLLGVRKYSSPDLCFIESGIQPVQDVIARRRRKFLDAKFEAPNRDEPFHIAFELCREAETPGYRFITQALGYQCNVNPLDEIKCRVREKPLTASKFVTYRTIINPHLSVHPAYMTSDFIPDFKRQALTRLRLMSHNLKIETGRRNGTPVELRLCSCNENQVQDESHVLIDCSLSRDCRARYNTLDFNSLCALMEGSEVKNLCDFIYDVLKIYL